VSLSGAPRAPSGRRWPHDAVADVSDTPPTPHDSQVALIASHLFSSLLTLNA